MINRSDNLIRKQKIREVIAEVIAAGEPIRHEQAFQEARKWRENISITRATFGQHVRFMKQENLIREDEKGYYHSMNSFIKRSDVQPYNPLRNEEPMAPSNPLNEREEIAPFFQKRSGQVVSIEHSPVEKEDVARVEVFKGGSWIELPLWTDIRICLGPSVPKWHPAQVTYEDVSRVRIVYKDGKRDEYNNNAAAPLTVAPKV